MIYEYLVVDQRYHSAAGESNRFFASNDFAEAKLVANEVGFNSVVVRFDPETGDHKLVYDAAFNTELPLAP